MDNERMPSFDPADVIIARVLKDWVNHPKLPWWTRSQLLNKAALIALQLPKASFWRVALYWVLSSWLDLVTLLTSDGSLIFVPSRDSYCWNPPHLSPCAVQTRVRDTFLLGAGMLGSIV